MKALVLDSRSRIRSGYQIVLAILLLLLASSVSSIGAIAFYSMPYVAEIVSGLLYAAAALGGAWFLFRMLFKNQYQGDLDCFAPKKKHSWLMLAVGLGFGLVCFSLAVAPLYLTGQYSLRYVGAAFLPLLAGFARYIGVGVAEEIITRGVIQHALLRFGKWPSLFITSAVFGLLHLANPGVTASAILGVTLAGIVLGMCMYATGSILFPIGFHITWNWVQGFVYGIAVSGTDTGATLFATDVVGSNSLITGGDFGAEASLPCLVVLTLVSLALFAWGRRKGSFIAYDADKNMPKLAGAPPMV